MSEWRVKYDGVCARCGGQLRRGTVAVWDRATRTMRCVDCSSPSADRPPEADDGVAGRSARIEYERRTAKRESAIKERWGTGRAATVVRILAREPQSTRAWAVGAAGEEKLARELTEVPGVRVLNDRRAPGTAANIDHVIIAPAGVFVVDAKAHRGAIDIRNRGWLLRPDHRLTVGGRDCSALADGMAWQVDAVAAALDGTAPMPPITPVLCFLEADFPLLGARDTFRGVRLESHRSLKRLLTKARVLDDARIAGLASILADRLPPK